MGFYVVTPEQLEWEPYTRFPGRHRASLTDAAALRHTRANFIRHEPGEKGPRLIAQARVATNPRQLVYEAQKLHFRATAVLEGAERAMGLRPGAGLQVDLQSTEEKLGSAIARAGRRVALALTASTALAATAVAATASHADAWLTPTFGAVAAVLTVAVLLDVMRGR